MSLNAVVGLRFIQLPNFKTLVKAFLNIPLHANDENLHKGFNVHVHTKMRKMYINTFFSINQLINWQFFNEF